MIYLYLSTVCCNTHEQILTRFKQFLDGDFIFSWRGGRTQIEARGVIWTKAASSQSRKASPN